jgi:hypothetical protein
MPIVGLFVSSVNGLAAERFRKFGGSESRAKFIGMEMMTMCVRPMCLVPGVCSRQRP